MGSNLPYRRDQHHATPLSAPTSIGRQVSIVAEVDPLGTSVNNLALQVMASAWFNLDNILDRLSIRYIKPVEGVFQWVLLVVNRYRWWCLTVIIGDFQGLSLRR